MPISECHLDAVSEPVRTRFPAFTGDLRGVQFVDGEAQGPIPRFFAERLAGILGNTFEIVGPWEPPAPPSPPPAPAKPAKPVRVR